MTKLQLALTSLIACFPALILVFFLITALLQFSDKMSWLAFGLVLGTLTLLVLGPVLMPLFILFGGRRKAAVVNETDGHTTNDGPNAADEDFELSGGLIESDEGLQDSNDSEMEIGASEFDLGESIDGPGYTDFESEIETEPVEEFEGLEFDDADFGESEEIEEDPKPKKKKR